MLPCRHSAVDAEMMHRHFVFGLDKLIQSYEPFYIKSILQLEPTMNLHDYFETNSGPGVLATADSGGNVDCAIYSRPHLVDSDTIAFIMADRQSHRNLQSNPKAVYLFKEEKTGYHGIRLYLEKTKEEKNSPLINDLRRKKREDTGDQDGKDRFLVYFKITGTRPLTGDDGNN